MSDDSDLTQAGTILLRNEALEAVVSADGAELRSLRTTDRTEWLWQGDPAYWHQRAPILFPVVGRSPDGHVSVGGQSYPMASHGFARDSPFEIIAVGATDCRLRLIDSASSRLSFPFAFRLDIEFSLRGGMLAMAVVVENVGDIILPCSFGLHPGFPYPLPGAIGPHAILLSGDAEPLSRHLDKQGLTEPSTDPSVFRKGVLALDPATFERGAIFLETGWGREIRFGAADGPQMRIETEGFPNLGLWTRPGAPFLCIEPCHGLPAVAGFGNALSERPGTMHLPPGAIARARMTIAPPPR